MFGSRGYELEVWGEGFGVRGYLHLEGVQDFLPESQGFGKPRILALTHLGRGVRLEARVDGRGSRYTMPEGVAAELAGDLAKVADAHVVFWVSAQHCRRTPLLGGWSHGQQTATKLS